LSRVAQKETKIKITDTKKHNFESALYLQGGLGEWGRRRKPE
jgi:hypothetical protein